VRHIAACGSPANTDELTCDLVVSDYCEDVSGSIEAWWSRLPQETRDWLVANNGDVVPAPVVDEITRAGGEVATDAWWVGENGPTGFYMSDAAIDWIEEVANGETPGRRGDS
jgi:hypothetical protein